MGVKRFQLNLNLQTMSKISIAAKLWDILDIKNQIRIYYSAGSRKPEDIYWSELSKNVLCYLNILGLPDKSLIPLEKKVRFIVEKTQQWIHYVTKVLKLDFILFKKIYWTAYGTVDEKKILDSYWKDMMDAYNFKTKSNYFKYDPIYLLACIFGHVRFVSEHAQDMIDDFGDNYIAMKKEDKIYSIIAFFVCATANKSLTFNAESPQNMFKLCIEAGFNGAAMFFWEKLDEIEKVLCVNDLAEKCVQEQSEIFLRDKHLDVLIFLISEMDTQQKQIFFAANGEKMIMMFLKVWPYQELILTVLDYLDMDHLNLCKLLKVIIKHKDDTKFPLELHFQIVQKVWENIPADEKVLLLKDDEIILSEYFDMAILDSVLNDPIILDDDTGVAESALETGCMKLIEIGKFDLVDEIAENILKTNLKPKESFKQNFIRVLFDLKINLDVDDRFLNRISNLDEERATFKKKMNVFEYFTRLTKRLEKRFDPANEFLNWAFKTEAEVKNFKERMKSRNFITAGGRYLPIKSGDLKELKPGDFIAMKPDDFRNCTSVAGFTFSMYDPVEGLMTTDILGIKRNDEKSRRFFSLLDSISLYEVKFVGIKPGDYILENVYKILKKFFNDLYSCDVACELSDIFIKCYYETDEEVKQFKENYLKDVDLFILTGNLYTNFLVKYYSRPLWSAVETLEKFFKFFSVPVNEVITFQICFRNNIEKFLDVYLIDLYDLDFVVFFLFWLYNISEQNETVEKFLNSPDRADRGILLCVNYLKAFVKSTWDLTIFDWLKMVEDKEKLRNDLRVLNENPSSSFFERLND